MEQSPIDSGRGQSLMEVLVAVTVGAIIIGSATGAILMAMSANLQSRAAQLAGGFAQELMGNLRSVAEGKWQTLYGVPAKGPSTAYNLAVYKQLAGTVAVTNSSAAVVGTGTVFTADLTVGDNVIVNSLPFTVSVVGSDTSITLSSAYSGSTASGLNIYRDFTIRSSTEQVISNNITFTRSFKVENVNRDACGAGTITTDAQTACSGSSGVLEDPSTQKITATVSWPQSGGTRTVTVVQYFSRTKDQVVRFDDWSGGTTTSIYTQPTNQYTSETDLNVSTPGAITLP
jgi:hypothetical protein